MNQDDLVFKSAADQAALIRSLKLSPVELVQASLERIAKYDATYRAYITVCAERALEDARKAALEAAIAERLKAQGPLPLPQGAGGAGGEDDLEGLLLGGASAEALGLEDLEAFEADISGGLP